MALLEFYGEDCPHCLLMKPIVAEVEKELGVTFEKCEVWNDEANAQKMEAIDCGRCGGVPYFYNDVTKAFVCGATDKEGLMKLVKGA